jgi:2,4-diaminopentanoate dehydrogenase
VIQWATGTVGKEAIRHFASNPAFELVGVLVTNPDKVGRDAGDIAGVGKTGVLATDDVEAILAMDADCVHYSPLVTDLDMISRLLKSGKNVVSPSGHWYATERYRDQYDKLEAACREGGTSYHGSGIHPGFAGDILALTTARLMDRIDCIHLYEIVNFADGPDYHYVGPMGFGQPPEEFLAKPRRSPEAMHQFAQSMAMVVEHLGKKIERLEPHIEVRLAPEDIEYPGGVIAKGTVAAQHFWWEAIVEGAPLVVFHGFWSFGGEIEPAWDCAGSKYRVIIEGNPRTEVTLEGALIGDGGRYNPGLQWTAMGGVTAIPDVCDGRVGVLTHLDLGVVKPRELVRR